MPLLESPSPPYLLFDCYPFDRGPLPDFETGASTDTDADGNPNVIGGILKCTDGVAYGYTGWFLDNWKRLSGFRGAYHYLQFGQDPRVQADFYLRIMALAGGWDARAIMPIVDVELGGERSANRHASAQQVIDCTTAWAERVRGVTGRRVMLYGRGAMRDLGICDKMGCGAVWNPSYTASPSMHGLEAWTLDDVVLWQYGGDGVGDASRHHLPLAIPGLGKIDLSVYVDGARAPTLESFRRRVI